MAARTKKKVAPSVIADTKILDMDQAIKRLKTTRPTFYRWLRAGRIKGMKAGRQWRFSVEEVERFLKGEQPRIELAVSIEPLIGRLDALLKGVNVSAPAAAEANAGTAVDRLIVYAVNVRTSDVHLHAVQEGNDRFAVARLRIDGVLHEALRFDARLLPALVERLKTMSACDLGETARPQDGRIRLNLPGRGEIDLRASFLPTVLGEAVTLRILARANVEVNLSLDRMDYSPRDRRVLDAALASPWGLILLTGPTGSGKTTNLYACVNHVTRPERKIVAVEDPVEFILPGVVQTQTNPRAGVTFAAAMRSFLRSDPDVIMVGELRDIETLNICQQAALTGHLVLSTMHTEDAAVALRRMVDMGSDAQIVADATKLVSAQRLVRSLCDACAAGAEPTAEELETAMRLARTGGLAWNELGKTFRAAVGCAQCHQTGYRGRRLMTEMLEVTPTIGTALRRGASAAELREIAVREGMTTMAADGIRRAAAGQTTIAEVLRVMPKT